MGTMHVYALDTCLDPGLPQRPAPAPAPAVTGCTSTRDAGALLRADRDAFCSMLRKHREQGLLQARTKWRRYRDIIRKDPEYLCMETNVSGSRPRELFADVMSELEEAFFKVCWPCWACWACCRADVATSTRPACRVARCCRGCARLEGERPVRQLTLAVTRCSQPLLSPSPDSVRQLTTAVVTVARLSSAAHARCRHRRPPQVGSSRSRFAGWPVCFSLEWVPRVWVPFVSASLGASVGVVAA